MSHPEPDLDTTWFDDDGELTELDDSDEDSEDEVTPTPVPPPRAPSPVQEILPIPRSKATRASTQKATDKSRARGGLKNTVPYLKPPRTTNYSASSLFDWIQDGLVELNPEYQRGVVWKDSKQSALIGSIVCNYYVPPIVFTVLRSNDGRETRVCIDGKQRLTSIKRFMLGEIPYQDATSNRKAYYMSPPGAKRKLIADAMRSNFKNKQITCVEYEDLTGEQEREIFQRVQLGVTLAPADRLPAINGPYANIVRDLRRRIETTQGFELYLNWGAARGKDFQALAQIVYLISYGQQTNKAEPTAMRLESFLSNQASDGGLSILQETAINVMDTFCRISYHRELGMPIRKNLSPLEFVMASYLVYLHRKKLSDSQLSEAMGRMRKEFGKACPDKKSSTKNFKFMMSFVQKEVPKLYSKLAPRRPSEKTAYETLVERIEVDPSHRRRSKKEVSASEHSSEKEYQPTTNGKVIGKRKRGDDDESQCSDDVYIPKKATKLKKEVKKQASLPSEAATSSTVKRERAPTSKLAKPRPSAKTVVKKPAAATKADRKQSLDGQVGKPSIRPPASSRNDSLSSIANAGQISVTVSVARPKASSKAGPSTSSASTVKKPIHPTPNPFSEHINRPPLPGRSCVSALEVAESANPAPASASASTNSGSGSTLLASPIFAPQTQVAGRSQAQGALPTRAAPQEVRTTSQVASRSPITDIFHAPCTSPPISLNSTGGTRGESRSAPSNNITAALAKGSRDRDASVRGQGQVQGQGSFVAMGSGGANTGARAFAGVETDERRRFPKFNKTVSARVDDKVVGTGQIWNAASQQQQQQTSISGPFSSSGNYTAQRSVSLASSPYLPDGSVNTDAYVNVMQAETIRTSTSTVWTGALVTPASTPNASPNIPEYIPTELRWPLSMGGSSQAAPTRDPRIVAREAAAQAAKLQQEQEQRRRQV